MPPHLLVALLAACAITPTIGAELKTYSSTDCSTDHDMTFTVPGAFCTDAEAQKCMKNVEAVSVADGGDKNLVGIAVKVDPQGGMFLTVAFGDGAETCMTKGDMFTYEIGPGVPGGGSHADLLDGKCVKVSARGEESEEEFFTMQLSGCSSDPTEAPEASQASQANGRRAHGLAMMIGFLAATKMF
eukprot:gnl/TRDRNA2_/TRDRNA2_173254_c0_seq10.p1 gnl/TRDRNA2_/TRDRNA2_173254_c0~~gnl/TRDRNA2_/TRDRNA2_173254_c0_seq10.p1  ORF type:complete len:186 (+),score=26.32 gnl/TRDRNA2_/TRDRNA2_173254_c0_seq10:99-656(+)